MQKRKTEKREINDWQLIDAIINEAENIAGSLQFDGEVTVLY